MLRLRRFDLLRWCALLACGLPCVFVGCAGTGLPMLCDPRPESQKLAEANKYDPYPDPTVGGDITGARPRGFITPRPDPDASKLQTNGPWPNVPPQPGYPPAQVVYPAGPVYPPATYPAATAPVVTPGYPASTVAPAPGATYLPQNATAPPLGTSSSTVLPTQTGSSLSASAPAVTYSATVQPAAYGTAISASP